MLLSKACDLTEIVAIAYACHGCFAPNSIANLSCREQQKNVDWAFLQALKTTNVNTHQGVLMIYDIACQYSVYLQDRIGHLLPDGLNIDTTISLFHVHGHKDTCFFRFATTFIPGAMVTIGKILESLWASLNTVTPALCTATLAHCAKIMDDHMMDSNHKKMLSIAASLSDRFTQKAATSQSAEEYYKKLTQSIHSMDVTHWEQQIWNAETQWSVDKLLMDILSAQKPEEWHQNGSHNADTANSPIREWLQMAIDIEEKQYVKFVKFKFASRPDLMTLLVELTSRIMSTACSRNQGKMIESR